MKARWIVVAAALLVSGCASTAAEPAAPAPSTSTAAKFPTPPYQVREDRQGYASAYVVDTLTNDELSRVLFAINNQFTKLDKTGGWFVQINCKSFEGPRQANGKLAFDRLGVAQTGMAGTFPEFEALESRQPC